MIVPTTSRLAEQDSREVSLTAEILYSPESAISVLLIVSEYLSPSDDTDSRSLLADSSVPSLYLTRHTYDRFHTHTQTRTPSLDCFSIINIVSRNALVLRRDKEKSQKHHVTLRSFAMRLFDLSVCKRIQIETKWKWKGTRYRVHTSDSGRPSANSVIWWSESCSLHPV